MLIFGTTVQRLDVGANVDTLSSDGTDTHATGRLDVLISRPRLVATDDCPQRCNTARLRG